MSRADGDGDGGQGDREEDASPPVASSYDGMGGAGSYRDFSDGIVDGDEDYFNASTSEPKGLGLASDREREKGSQKWY